MADLRILEALPGLTIVGGIGNYAENTACVMSAAVAEDRLRRGKPLGEATDELECVCPVVRTLAIYRNLFVRYADDAERTTWALGMVPRLLDSRRSVHTTRSRAEEVARYAVRVVAAEMLDRAGLQDWAERLRALPENVDMSTARLAADAAWRAAQAVAYDQSAPDAARAAAGDAVVAAFAAADASRAASVATDHPSSLAHAALVAARTAKQGADPKAHLDAMIEAALRIA